MSPAIARGESKNGRRSVVVLLPISVHLLLKTRPNGSVGVTKVITNTRGNAVSPVLSLEDCSDVKRR